MSFSPAWLALREPADLAARDRTVLAACRDAFISRRSISVCDLGSGTGASVRAFADLLPSNQSWTLVDNDARNLEAALDALSAWADESSRAGAVLYLRHGLREIQIRTRVHDFSADPACWPEGTDLVTASALFDLASQTWLERFGAALASAHIPLLSTLTADGVIEPRPALPLDEKVAAAFRHHQTRDKGFGPSAGANAAHLLENALTNAGYRLVTGDSPWQLYPADGGMLQATLDGIVLAVAETERVDAQALAAWAKEVGARQLIIGHRDVFATPA